jgi:hypothetical protein
MSIPLRKQMTTTNNQKELYFVEEYYDNHLGYFYSWMLGDFGTNIENK